MSDFEDRQWERAGRQAKARSNAVREPIRRVVRQAKEKDLDDIRFASPIAWKRAFDAELNWTHFVDVAQSSERGYNVEDVRRIIRDLEGDAD